MDGSQHTSTFANLSTAGNLLLLTSKLCSTLIVIRVLPTGQSALADQYRYNGVHLFRAHQTVLYLLKVVTDVLHYSVCIQDIQYGIGHILRKQSVQWTDRVCNAYANAISLR